MEMKNSLANASELQNMVRVMGVRGAKTAAQQREAGRVAASLYRGSGAWGSEAETKNLGAEAEALQNAGRVWGLKKFRGRGGGAAKHWPGDGD